MTSKKFITSIIITFVVLIFITGCAKSPSGDDSPRNWKYFNIYASSEDDIIFVQLQDDLGISPKMERYILTVNITNKNNLYIMIGGEQNSSAKKYPWSGLRASVQQGLLGWIGSNKERLE
ncbi:MAG: hypothetical protein HY959_00635 [Ignavibacteriae bacterium]|nr:hypothetical protein [Ignavibacteriota bacterium]